MQSKTLLFSAAALACIAIGFVAAQQVDRVRYEKRIVAVEKRHAEEGVQLLASATQWADAVASMQAEVVLRAFTAGISPTVLAGRRDGIAIAAVSLLNVPGIAGIHVLGLDGAVLYSSDAKLVATGKADDRGEWALQASGLTSRPSTRPGVTDLALPIANAEQPLAVVWLEYDVGSVREAARPAALRSYRRQVVRGDSHVAER